MPPIAFPFDTLLEALPSRTGRLRILGESASALEAELRQRCPDLNIVTDSADAVLVSDPIPPNEIAEVRMAEAVRAADGGGVLALFRCGEGEDVVEAFLAGAWQPPRPGQTADVPMGEFSRRGVEIVFSRADYEPEQWFEIGDAAGALWGWLVRAQPRPATKSPLRAQHDERRAVAAEHNARGEALYAQGDHRGALAAFAQAIGAWNGEAVYFNNMAILLCSLGAYEEAWPRLLDAMHLDPTLQTARENLAALAPIVGKQEEAEELLSLYPPNSGQTL